MYQRLFWGTRIPIKKKKKFWGTQIPALANVTSEMRYKRNSELIEFVDNKPGSFRNTTVNGQITGFSLDLGVGTSDRRRASRNFARFSP